MNYGVVIAPVEYTIGQQKFWYEKRGSKSNNEQSPCYFIDSVIHFLWYCAIVKNFYYYIRNHLNFENASMLEINSNIDYPYANYIIDVKSIVAVRTVEEES